MIQDIRTISFEADKLPVPTCDILRYSGCREQNDPQLCALANDCLKELLPMLSLKAVYTTLPVKFSGTVADFGFCKHNSKSLLTFLGGDCNVHIFAATVGIGADRLISRYSPILPSRAVTIDAAATAAIECWCDYLCSEVFSINASARFSPGYGDLPLSMQKDILSLLDTHLNIGVSMMDSMLLTPTKSVTAIAKAKD